MTLKAQIREDMLSVAELEMVYKATCENLGRLRYTERNLLDESNASSSNESEGLHQIIMGLQQRRRNSNRILISQGMTSDDSFSVMSRYSGQPLVHVDNYFQKSSSSFNY